MPRYYLPTYPKTPPCADGPRPSGWLQTAARTTAFPVGTLGVNVIGCLLIGVAFGFASAWPALDFAWTDAFADTDVGLHLLPPLAASIRRNGGFRCASQHVR